MTVVIGKYELASKNLNLKGKYELTLDIELENTSLGLKTQTYLPDNSGFLQIKLAYQCCGYFRVSCICYS
jgi:hypothetical protein